MPFSPAEQDLQRMEHLYERLKRGKVRIHVPESPGLHQRRPNYNFHPNPEFFLQTGGASDFDCPGSKFSLATGDICIMPAGVPHAETPVDLETPYSILVVIQNREGCILLRGTADTKRRIRSQRVLPLPGSGHAFRCLDHVSHQNQIDPRLRPQFVQSLTEAFLVSLLSELRHPGADKNPVASPLVTEAEKLVSGEISHPDITVGSIAARLGCSPDHLTRRFRAERGMTMNVWISRERIQLARELLAQPGRNVAEIGWTCGFTSPSYFIRVFRAHTGMTPKTWRQRERTSMP